MSALADRIKIARKAEGSLNLERSLERSEDLIWLLLHLHKTYMTMENTRRKMYLQLQIATFLASHVIFF